MLRRRFTGVGACLAAKFGFRLRILAAAVALMAAMPPGPAAAVGETTSSGRPVGVLIVDHGEPAEYNEWTYYSFRKFFAHLVEMGIVPSFLTRVDGGTILQDLRCPFCNTPSDDPQLIDAWLRPHPGPAVFVRGTDDSSGHYVLPGGPGLGEPDIFEQVGFGAWSEWRSMGGRSPNYDEKLPRKESVVARLKERYGDRVAVRVGYFVDPRIGGGEQSIRRAIEGLVNRDRIGSLVIAYHGVTFSDIMQTHMIRPDIALALKALGADRLPLRYAPELGLTEQYVAAVVEKARAELAEVPGGTPVAIHLSGHGMPVGRCGNYDCGADGYHAFSKTFFERVRDAIVRDVPWSARLGVFHVYASGDSEDPKAVDGPAKALAKAKKEGFGRVIVIPHEFEADSVDTLLGLRRGYGREAPDWNSRFESSFSYEGIPVKIANSSDGDALKVAALQAGVTVGLG
jgi:protoheme ferro-lyase